jgi:hypothetical protein
MDISQLPDQTHVDVDQETRVWVRQTPPPAVVEGTFLRHVLADSENVILIVLTCETAFQEQRFDSAGKGGVLLDRLAADEGLMRRLYGDAAQRVPNLTVNTTGMSVNGVVEMIVDFVDP